GRGAIEIYWNLLLYRASADFQREIWSVDPIGKLSTIEGVKHPPDRLAIRHKKLKLIEAEALLSVQRAGHEPMHRKSGNGRGPLLFGSTEDNVDSAFVIHYVDQDAKDISFAAVEHSPLHRSMFS